MRVLFRCDGTRAVGLGHVSRCVALAEALEELGCSTSFAGAYDTGAHVILGGRPHRNVAPGIAGGPADADLVVIDGYAFAADAVVELAPHLPPERRVMIDDFAAHASYPPATVLNFTVEAERLDYRGAPHRLLLGPRYFLARRSLRAMRSAKAHRPGAIGQPEGSGPPGGAHPNVGRILVAMGGHDARNLTFRCVRAILHHSPRTSVRAVLREDHPDAEALRTLLSDGARPESQPNESALLAGLPDLSGPFGWADACLTTGGLTKYEAAFLGIPAAVVSQTAEEAHETAAFAGRGLATDLGFHDQADTALSDRIGAWLNALEQHSLPTPPDVFGDDPTAHAARALLRGT